MTNPATIALRALVFPVAFAAILSCVQLRIEAAQHAPEMVAAAKGAVSEFTSQMAQATSSIFDNRKGRITVASR